MKVIHSHEVNTIGITEIITAPGAALSVIQCDNKHMLQYISNFEDTRRKVFQVKGVKTEVIADIESGAIDHSRCSDKKLEYTYIDTTYDGQNVYVWYGHMD